MRTTINLPDDVHAMARSIARDRGWTFSATVVDLVRRGLGNDEGKVVYGYDETTGLPVFWVGHPVTADDVRSLEDD